MDYRKDNWSYELECIREAVRGNDGFSIDLADHYTVDRLGNDQYADRTYDELDIAVAIFEGTIIEGYSCAKITENEGHASLDLLPPAALF